MGHTPGPWEIVEQQTRIIIKSHNRKADASGFGRTIATINGDWHPSSGVEGYYAISTRQETDARRIVACVNACEGINPEAVPELLAACDVAVEALDRLGADASILDVLESAIAKAKGEPCT